MPVHSKAHEDELYMFGSILQPYMSDEAKIQRQVSHHHESNSQSYMTTGKGIQQQQDSHIYLTNPSYYIPSNGITPQPWPALKAPVPRNFYAHDKILRWRPAAPHIPNPLKVEYLAEPSHREAGSGVYRVPTPSKIIQPDSVTVIKSGDVRGATNVGKASVNVGGTHAVCYSSPGGITFTCRYYAQYCGPSQCLKSYTSWELWRIHFLEHAVVEYDRIQEQELEDTPEKAPALRIFPDVRKAAFQTLLRCFRSGCRFKNQVTSHASNCKGKGALSAPFKVREAKPLRLRCGDVHTHCQGSCGLVYDRPCDWLKHIDELRARAAA